MPGAGGTPGESDAPRELAVEVSATQATYVKLSVPGVVNVTDAASSTDWDLGFEGYDVMTNGGISGPGRGAAFGPLSVSVFAFPDQPVDVPFLISDGAGGAFLDWYAYDETTHVLFSRYHVYGVKSGGRLYKLQILRYYVDVGGVGMSAHYQLRYAEVTATGSGETVELDDLDATLGETPSGPAASTDAPGPCLSLATGETIMLSLADAESSTDWDLCFRRDAINVNGERGGPGDVAAVDLDAAATAGETLADVEARTSVDEEAAFDAVDDAALTAPDLVYRGDQLVTAFTGQWADASASPPVPTAATAFMVVGADGQSRYLVAFDAFDGANADTPGTVHLGVEPAVSP